MAVSFYQKGDTILGYQGSNVATVLKRLANPRDQFLAGRPLDKVGGGPNAKCLLGEQRLPVHRQEDDLAAYLFCPELSCGIEAIEQWNRNVCNNDIWPQLLGSLYQGETVGDRAD